jgi:hypothetical protein
MIDSFTGEFRFLSNFYHCDIFYFGQYYSSTENAYQAAKTKDLEIRSTFSILTPNQAKRQGKKLKLRDDWESVKVKIMEEILRLKFNQEKFKNLLLNTEDEYLIEGNTWNDKEWGMCDGEGKNKLGLLLMKIRNDLKGNSNERSN